MAKKSNPTIKRKGLRRLAPLHGSPSSIKLKYLLEKITPLPWRLDVITGHLLFSNSRNLKREEDDIVKARATYLTHAANVLPQVVDELHSMLGDALKYPQLELCDHHKQRLIGIISRIEEVKMENDPKLSHADRRQGSECNDDKQKSYTKPQTQRAVGVGSSAVLDLIRRTGKRFRQYATTPTSPLNITQ